MARLETAFGPALAQNLPSLHRRIEAFERQQAQRFELEGVADELSGLIGDHDAIGGCLALKPCRQVGGFAAGAQFCRRRAGAHLANDNQAGRDPDPGVQAPLADRHAAD